MRVEVAYRGRIEAFDTDRFTEAQPFSGKSMLADLTLDYADVEKKGLWLTAHCYAANEAYRTDGGEAPEARREKGWRFQLATPREAAGIESVTLDGSTVLARLFGELVDVARVDRACALFPGNLYETFCNDRTCHGCSEKIFVLINSSGFYARNNVIVTEFIDDIFDVQFGSTGKFCTFFQSV